MLGSIGKSSSDSQITGHIRTRAESQGMALRLGDRCSVFKHCDVQSTWLIYINFTSNMGIILFSVAFRKVAKAD